jgi:hypothetical protein
MVTDETYSYPPPEVTSWIGYTQDVFDYGTRLKTWGQHESRDSTQRRVAAA